MRAPHRRRGSLLGIPPRKLLKPLTLVSGGREPPLYLVERLWRGSVGGWLLAAAGRAVSPCHIDGPGGVVARRGRVPGTSDRDMPSGLDVKWLRRRRREHPTENAPGPKEFRHARTRLRRHRGVSSASTSPKATTTPAL